MAQKFFRLDGGDPVQRRRPISRQRFEEAVLEWLDEGQPKETDPEPSAAETVLELKAMKRPTPPPAPTWSVQLGSLQKTQLDLLIAHNLLKPDDLLKAANATDWSTARNVLGEAAFAGRPTDSTAAAIADSAAESKPLPETTSSARRSTSTANRLVQTAIFVSDHWGKGLILAVGLTVALGWFAARDLEKPSPSARAENGERRGVPPFKLELSGTANETMEISDVRVDPWLKFNVRFRGSNCATCQWHWTAFDGGGATITRGVVHYRGRKEPGELACAEIVTGQGFAKVAKIEIDYR